MSEGEVQGKPKAIILDTECSEHFEATRKHRRREYARTVTASKPELISELSLDSSSSSTPDAVARPLLDESIPSLFGAYPTLKLQGQEVGISISHDGEYATAVAIVQYDDHPVTKAKRNYRFRKTKSSEEEQIDQ
jgi:hypothetical protein